MKRIIRSALLGTAAAALIAPAAAQAASVRITQAGGSPQTITPGLPVRDVTPYLPVSAGPKEYHRLTVVAPDNATVLDHRCSIGPTNRLLLGYRGNGTYRVTLRSYGDDSRCATPTSTQNHTFSINAYTRLGLPSVVLTRNPGSYATRSYTLPADIGANARNEVWYGNGASLAPNGVLTGAEQAFVLQSTRSADVRFRTPGTYNFFSRAGYNGAWSPWITGSVRAIAPFDISRLRFSDQRGPSYRVVAYVGERSVSGKARVYLARGTKGGKYRRLGTVRIRRGQISKRFTTRRAGKYRLKYKFSGSATVAPGSATMGVRVYRRYYRR